MISASGWLFKKKSITMHGNMNAMLLLLLPTSSRITHIKLKVKLIQCVTVMK